VKSHEAASQYGRFLDRRSSVEITQGSTNLDVFSMRAVDEEAKNVQLIFQLHAFFVFLARATGSLEQLRRALGTSIGYTRCLRDTEEGPLQEL
jgi:hypothetical protein